MTAAGTAAPASKIDAFRALHVPGTPLILYNIWDAGSTRAVAKAGARAIATGSYGVAEARGARDGEALSFDDAIANLEEILSVTDLPVSCDIESGYGADAAAVGQSAQRVCDTGAVGVNMEDRMAGQDALIPIAEAAARYAAAAATGLFVNARCDQFRGHPAAEHGPALVDATIARAQAYADAGASGLFVPFTANLGCIAAICERSPLPVNILWRSEFTSAAELSDLGVARISHGHGPWAAAMEWLGRRAQEAFAGQVPDYG